MSETTLPEPWVTARLADVTQKIADRDHYTPTYVEAGVVMISPKDFDEEGRIDFTNCKFISQVEHTRNRRKTDITAGDLVFTRIGARLGKACLVTPEMPEFSLLHSAVMIRTASHRVLPEYLLFILKGHELQSQIGREIQSIGVPDLGLDKINAFVVTLPPLPQQRKIARILTTVDNLIEKTEALIAKYQAIKQGMMHDLFTRGVDEHGHLRPTYEEAPELYKQSDLGWIPKEWECIPACESCEAVIDCKNRTPPDSVAGFRVVKTTNIRNGSLLIDTMTYTDARSYELWTTRGKPTEGDVLITREAPVGEVGIVEKEMPAICLGQRITMYKPCKSRIQPLFLLHALMSYRVQDTLRRRAGGSTVGHVRVGDIKFVRIPVCSLSEQGSIAGSLSEVTKKIELEYATLAQYLNIKTGLMQDLLTGKVRVKVNEAEEVAARA